MKKFILSVAAAICVFSFASASVSTKDLPKVYIAGSQYYLYEVKKGDSLYGIANRYGWNIDKLEQLNPSIGSKLDKGAKVYYPVDIEDRKDEDLEDSDFTPPEAYPVIRHVVKKGDSVYSIAKMYGVKVDKVYLYNPSAKTQLRRGDVITIPQESELINDGSSFLYYTIKDGDTLADIATAYNTSVEQLLRDNKGVSENNFASGDILRISVNSNKDNLEVKEVEETRIARIDTYKAAKNDTWETVAEKTGVDIEDLLEANSGTHLKKNAQIAVPVIETVTVEKEVEPFDERESSLEGRRDIYKEVHMLVPEDSVAELTNSVSMAILIEDPMSKRDNEFTRGALLAIDGLKNSPYKIRLKVLCDNRASNDSVKVTESLKADLDDFKADIVVTTYEKNFPAWLAQYGEDNGVEIVNSFDVKNEMYMENPSMIHLLTPSAYFSDEVGEWVASTLGSYKLVLVGKEDAEDAFAESIKGRRDKSSVISRKLDDLAELKLDEGGRYLFYGYPTSRDEIQTMLTAIEYLKENNPFVEMKVLGRPSWITVAEGLRERFQKADVYFPSRFFFDHTAGPGKEFIATYSSAYGHSPIRSFPTYAVAGYDIANYFIPGIASNDGDFNASIPDGREIQTPINLERVGNWGGFFNPSAYIIRYSPYGDIEKILIRR
ncbi:MAG: LysM peptidoglycan-binding domain-containing protein [Muribaculaceae bacterium]|nr:LysM peptidoglycan-binding domain-containing protein [Muribaculaceae bacterium]